MHLTNTKHHMHPPKRKFKIFLISYFFWNAHISRNYKIIIIDAFNVHTDCNVPYLVCFEDLHLIWSACPWWSFRIHLSNPLRGEILNLPRSSISESFIKLFFFHVTLFKLKSFWKHEKYICISVTIVSVHCYITKICIIPLDDGWNHQL